jgi:UDP-N-acetylmuramoyl-tripeptide--D-alanyl-D-alanine ligase
MATPIPPNQATFTLSELAQATGAVFNGVHDTVIRGIATDSRADLRGKLFVALCGDRFDGHEYLQEAAARGAAAVLVERDDVPDTPAAVLRVPSTLRALGDIAQRHRQNWRGRVIAVVGSAGKTTTRVAIETVLGALLGPRVHATKGNLNNQVGVPMTLLGLTEHHEIAVIEVGTNARGEVERLSELCMPQVAVLTLIGLEHTEGLIDLDGVEWEEGRVFAALTGDAMAIGNGDDERVMNQLSQIRDPNRRRTFGCQRPADYHATHQVADSLDHTSICIRRSDRAGGGQLSLDTRLLGLPGAMAVTAAVAVAETLGLGIDPDCVNAALMRSNLGETGRLKAAVLSDGTVVLDDSYNANPPSMLSSIALANDLARRRSGRMILVLGEMRELGQHSEREHTMLGTQLGQVAQLIAVGAQAEALHRSAQACGKDSAFVLDATQAAQLVPSLVRSGDVVLVKGSRGVHLETVVESLMAWKGYAA